MRRLRLDRIVFFLCAIAITYGSCAQKRGPAVSKNVDVHFGPVYKQNNLSSFVRTLKADETGMLLLRQRINVTSFAEPLQYYIEKFNANMELISSYKVDMKGLGQRYTFQDMFHIADRFYFLIYDYSKETDMNSLYVTTVSETGALTNDLVKICEVPSERRMFGAFHLYFSADGSKLAIKKRIKDDEKKELLVLEVYNVTFGESLKVDLLWEKEIRLPYRDKKYNVASILMANDGNVHMLSQVTLEREERSKGMPGYFYEVFSCFYETDEIKQYPINLGKNYIADISFLSNNPNSMAGSGLYKEEKGDRVKGFFYFQIDIPSRKVAVLSQQEFPDDFVKQFLTERQVKKGASDLSDFSTRLFISNPAGGGIVIAEYYKYTMTHSYTGGSPGITSDWRYEDLIICRINPDGTFAWLKKIPKKQKSTHDTGVWNTVSSTPIYIGIGAIVTADKVRIIYNENPANLTETDPTKLKYMADPKHAVTTLITIDQSGNFIKAPLFPSKASKTVVTPSIRCFLTPNTFVMTALRKKKYSFVKVTFKPDVVAITTN